MKYFLYILLTFCVFSEAFAQMKSERRYNAFSGNIVFSAEGGMTIAATDYVGTHPDYIGKATLEYFFPAFSASTFGLRIFGNTGFISEKEGWRTPPLFRTTIATGGAGIIFMLNAGDFFFPYLFAGAGWLWFDPKDEAGNHLINDRLHRYDKHELNYLGEFGMRFLITDNLSFNLSTGMQISPNDVWDDSKEGGTNDLMITAMAGFSFAFYFPNDDDNDGVDDSRDLCPGTPRGIAVDYSGCPRDGDKDGVPDYKDRCPDTPSRVKVDQNGCPLDSDGDGVLDYMDLCPGTPKGMVVDKSGCSIDDDGDGVPDNIDKCPDTPNNIPVNPDGCPKDDDLDGVPDYRDKCPQTPAGERVDNDGCSITGDVVKRDSSSKEIILSSGASFESGKTTILPSAFEQLNKLVLAMQDDISSRWRIEGYTDNVGSEASNQKISLQRAQAVLEYFVSKGINRTRFVVIGYGESNPVASNSTEEGKAKNRRVRIVRIN